MTCREFTQKTLPTFESWFGCMSLRIGILVFGYIYLILSLLGIAFSSSMIAEPVGFEDSTLGTVILIASVINLIFVACLLYGGHNEKRAYIKTYLIYSIVLLVFGAKSIIVSLVTAPCIGILPYLVSYAFEIYFVLVIRSYIVKMEDNKEDDRNSIISDA